MGLTPAVGSPVKGDDPPLCSKGLKEHGPRSYLSGDRVWEALRVM